MIPEKNVAEIAPERMEHVCLDPHALHLHPELPPGFPGAVGVRENPDFHPACYGGAKHHQEFPAGIVILQDVGFHQDLILRSFDGLEHGRESLFAAKEQLDLVAIVDGTCLNATD